VIASRRGPPPRLIAAALIAAATVACADTGCFAKMYVRLWRFRDAAVRQPADVQIECATAAASRRGGTRCSREEWRPNRYTRRSTDDSLLLLLRTRVKIAVRPTMSRPHSVVTPPDYGRSRSRTMPAEQCRCSRVSRMIRDYRRREEPSAAATASQRYALRLRRAEGKTVSGKGRSRTASFAANDTSDRAAALSLI